MLKAFFKINLFYHAIIKAVFYRQSSLRDSNWQHGDHK